MKTYQIHILRHGMTEANEKGLYIGRTDLPLSADGFVQLERMKAVFTYPNARLFFCAAQHRCRQTLAVLYPQSQPRELVGLNECDFGAWENRSIAVLKQNPQFVEWMSGKSGVIPDGEPPEVFQKRVMATFEDVVREMLKSGETEAVLCVSGGVLMLLMAAYGLPRLSMREWATDSGCGFTLRITPEVWMREPVAEALCAIPWKEEDPDPIPSGTK